MSFAPIKCPHCGYDGIDAATSNMPKHQVSGGFRYLEDITCYRQVGHVEDQDLHIDGFYQTGEGYDDGENRRLECRACYGEFPIPEGMELWFD